MKKLIQIIIGLFVSQALLAQSDSVLLSRKPGLMPEYQIIYPKGEIGIRETYTYFKYRYWLGKTDTILLNKFIETKQGFKEDKKWNPLKYNKVGVCDSKINEIRNSSSYWKMRSEINQIARKEIGYGNDDFGNYQYSQANNLSDFLEKCFLEYKSEEDKVRQKVLTIIDSIKTIKAERFKTLKSNKDSITSKTIFEFLSKFDECSFDLKSLEIIILNKPEILIQELEKLNDIDFYSFTLKINAFPKNTNINAMKASLKKTNINTARTNKLIMKINITKG